MIDLEVIGRHALLFDDDAMASFVNSNDALVQWNSLLIDRYDVRHLLSSLPPRRTRQLTHSTISSSTNSDLDHERYQDLPPPCTEEELDEEKFVNTGGYRAVAFSYGIPNDSTFQNKPDAEIQSSGFVPPFPVPENLLQSLPPTYKSHQIIARTALFVASHGGQSEIILRVKQGDNPTFGFLMPDNHLHPYFRFLVENKHLLQPDSDVKSVKEKGDLEINQSGGALSLLGSVYGSGEDEDAAVGKSEESKENVTKKDSCLQCSDKAESPLTVDGGDQMVLKRPNSSKLIPLKKNTLVGELKTGTSHSTRKGDSGPLVLLASEKLETSSIQNVSTSKPPVLEPPSDVKRSINKIIEFIIKNGKQYEAVLIEQDRKYGRFPFLLPSSQYHPYYSKVLQEANQSKLTVKGSSSVQAQDKNAYIVNERDEFSLGSSGYDIPYDYSDRKEKFKMVIGKSKKDVQDVGEQPQIGIAVDAAAAAAILRAATRGLKYPDLGILTNGDKRVRSSEGGVHSGKDESTNEADLTETNMTKDQKMKAERLKRAKMFVAKIKNEVDTTTGRISSPSKGGIISTEDKEREVKSVPLVHNVDYSSERKRKPEKQWHEDEYSDGRKSRRKYRSKSSREHEDKEDEESEYEKRRDHHHHKQQKQRSRKHNSHQSSDDKEEEEKERDHMRSRKKNQSHNSSRYEEEEADRDKDGYRQHSRKKKRRHGSYSSDDEQDEVTGEKDDEVKYQRKKQISSSSDHHGRDKRERNYYSSRSKKRDERRASRSRSRDSSVSDGGRNKSKKKRKERYGDDDKLLEELEEGEIEGSITKVGVVEEEEATVVDDLAVCNNNSNGVQQRTSSFEAGGSSQVVSDDLRAKIRAMLMANM